MRTEIQTGIADGEWVEVTNRRVKSESTGKEQEMWVPIEPSEQVLTGSKLSTLTDGAPVRLARSPAPTEGGGSAKTTSGATGAE